MPKVKRPFAAARPPSKRHSIGSSTSPKPNVVKTTKAKQSDASNVSNVCRIQKAVAQIQTDAVIIRSVQSIARDRIAVSFRP